MRPATRHADVATTVLGSVVLAAPCRLLTGRPETAVALGVTSPPASRQVSSSTGGPGAAAISTELPRGRWTTVVPVSPWEAEAAPPLAVPRQRSGRLERVQCGLAERGQFG